MGNTGFPLQQSWTRTGKPSSRRREAYRVAPRVATTPARPIMTGSPALQERRGE
jgi:hypothetical protein